ncbi:hypothetical protein ACFL1B_05320 [Nanoarchaeota archaeon]
MEDKINAYTEEWLEEQEENGGMSTFESSFIRGADMAYEEAEEAEDEAWM